MLRPLGRDLIGDPFAEGLFRYLAERGDRQVVQQFQPLGQLELRDFLGIEKRDQLFERKSPANLRHNVGAHALAETLDLNTLTQVIGTSGTFASTLLEGAVTFETLQDFVIVLDDNPSAGQLLISDSSSSVLITVLDNISVQLDIDIDLDGTIDESIVVTWADLDID